MASLANVTQEVRLIGKIAGASFIGIIALFLLYNGGLFIKNTLFPTPLPPPEQAFGELPEINFPPQTPANYTYIVNTVDGNLPFFSDRVTVYKTIKKEPSLVALQEARTSASNVGFTNSETKITDNIYRWSNRFGDRLEMDILTKNFKILTNYLNNAPPVNISGPITNKDETYGYVARFLSDMGINISDLNSSISQTAYLRLEGGQLVKTENQSDAQLVRLDIYQNLIDELPIVYPNYPESALQFLLITNGNQPRIVDASFTYNIPDLTQGSTYPIKNTAAAFDDLKNGNAVVYSALESGSSVDITDVRLGYYLSENEEDYLLPIFIFIGPEFTAYVNALGQYPPTQ